MNFGLVSVKINVRGIFLISHPHLSKAFVENHFPTQFKALAVLNMHRWKSWTIFTHKSLQHSAIQEHNIQCLLRLGK